MSKYDINNSSFIKYKNKSFGGDEKYKLDFNNSIKVIENFLKNKNYDFHENDIFFQVKYLYDNIPPKTSRINFRKVIQDVNSIPQKDIQVIKYKENIYETILTYKITLQEFDIFLNDLKLILKNKDKINIKEFDSIKPKSLKKLIANISLVKEIQKIPRHSSINQLKLIKFYKMYDDMEIFFKKIGIDPYKSNYNEILNIIFLSPKQFDFIKEKYPWIIMKIEETTTLGIEVLNLSSEIFKISLPIPKNNIPTIGVIDSGNLLAGDFEKYIDGNYNHIESSGYRDYFHGSIVASLIIANDELNPSAKDSLGNFKVRHFEVLSKNYGNSSSANASFNHLSKKIEEIVSNNKDIKIWNLSLGGLKSPWTLRISNHGMLLDYLSSKYDCLFIVASGNHRLSNNSESLNMPGDSLNALTVGSVSYNFKLEKIVPSEYSSIGAILHFMKPEVSNFGGENNFDGSLMNAHDNSGIISFIKGTSFSAPRISRIAGWLLKEGYSILEIKAMIIASTQRETESFKSSAYGYIGNFNEGFTLKTTIELFDNSPLYLPLNLQNVENVILSACNMVIPVSSLGEEYSISNAEVSLVQYRSDYKEFGFESPEEEKGFKKSLTQKEKSNSNFLKEKHRRYLTGKYFTSKKIIYDLNKNTLIGKNWCYALRIRRSDLFNINEKPPLKIGLVLKLSGKNLNEETFIKHNNTIVNAEVDIEIKI